MPSGASVFDVVVLTTLTLSHMYVHTRIAPGPGAKWTVSVSKNTTALPIASCEIVDPFRACDASGTAMTFAPGDQVVIIVTPTNNPRVAPMSVGVGP